jgi:flagellar hook-length control protein FliK
VRQKSEPNIQKNMAPLLTDPGLAKIENFDEVIQKASYMAKDGGGEMKIQLRPDGLGQVDLKVTVNNGTVNVEMIAENAETKKLLEGGLDSLKHSLSSGKVNVEAIKVDIGNNLRNEMSQQGFNQDADQARQFMNDFRQENNSRRDGMNDLGILAERARDRVQSKTQDVKTSSTNTNPKTGSGRLHVVA